MLASGFTSAPVSRFLVFTIAVSSILASITDTKHFFFIQIVPHLWGYGQLWRLLVWQLCYLNSTEVLFAAMTFYNLRIVERLWGSRKFASFLISTTPYTLLLPPLFLTILIRPLTFYHPITNYLPAGPTPLVFALLAQYHAAIPHIYKYRIATSSSTSTTSGSSSSSSSASPTLPALDLTLTSKTLTYLPCAQLALSQLPTSLLTASVGWVVGYAWRSELLPGARWRIPEVLWGGGKGGGSREERRRVEGLRRRMEGEVAEVSGSAAGGEGAGEAGEARRRTLGGQILDQFRGTL
ncbi:hypothetical protein EV356DRAFT_522035 [Viridothelium virens]|uniref:Peptidase S54 rhomboid domain-containing protein n=1 Tax=Viridothelium virens TaxID=1048519 RepID=A0A6A6GSQ7_VIRVR|nr:hypothetical protein EV356DRAFT_522035 [Viridothelium virens]